MTPLTAHAALAARQHQVISTAQLRSLGYSKDAIRHLVRSAHLRVHVGVFAVGREQLTERGRWKAAELAGPDDGGHVNYQDDRAKRALQAAGYIVLPFTWAEVMYRPAEVARAIRAVMRRRAHLVG